MVLYSMIPTAFYIVSYTITSVLETLLKTNFGCWKRHHRLWMYPVLSLLLSNLSTNPCCIQLPMYQSEVPRYSLLRWKTLPTTHVQPLRCERPHLHVHMVLQHSTLRAPLTKTHETQQLLALSSRLAVQLLGPRKRPKVSE